MKLMLFNEFEFYGLKPSETQLDLWVDELKDLTKEEVRLALDISRKDNSRTKPPLPAVIRSEASGFIDAEQAWSESPKSEDDSAVITDEAAKALSYASQFIRAGNMIQARLVFLEVYKNEVINSLANKKKAKWFASFGAYSTPEEKDRAIMNSVSKNRISNKTALSYRSHLQLENKTNLKLLTSSQDEEFTDEQRSKNLEKTRYILETLNKKNEIKKTVGTEG